jgi:hypothetical protein
VLGKDGVRRLNHKIVVNFQINALEDDFLGVGGRVALIDLEGDAEVRHGALDREVLTLSARVRDLSRALDFNVITFNSYVLLLVQGQFVVEFILSASVGLKRYLEILNGSVA